MLEFDKAQYNTNIKDLKDFITIVFVIISEFYAKVAPTSVKKRKNIDKLKMSDEEIITIAIVGKLIGNDSETAWFHFCERNFSDLFPSFCDRTRFNRIRRNLQTVINEIRKEINRMIQPTEVQIIDSLPLPVCKFGRTAFHKTFHGYGATYGRCDSKRKHILVIELIKGYRSLLGYLLADKGYSGKEFKDKVQRQTGVSLLPMPKSVNFNLKMKSIYGK